MTDRQTKTVVYAIMFGMVAFFPPAIGFALFLCLMDFVENR